MGRLPHGNHQDLETEGFTPCMFKQNDKREERRGEERRGEERGEGRRGEERRGEEGAGGGEEGRRKDEHIK